MPSSVRRGAVGGDMPLSLSLCEGAMDASSRACALILKRSPPIRSCMGKRRVCLHTPHRTFHVQPASRSHVRYVLQSQRLDGSFAQHKLLRLAAGRPRIALFERDVARIFLWLILPWQLWRSSCSLSCSPALGRTTANGSSTRS